MDKIPTMSISLMQAMIALLSRTPSLVSWALAHSDGRGLSVRPTAMVFTNWKIKNGILKPSFPHRLRLNSLINLIFDIAEPRDRSKRNLSLKRESETVHLGSYGNYGWQNQEEEEYRQ